MDSDYSRKQKSDVDLEVTGISRSGRVRKKSSKLMDFESPDDIDARPRKVQPPPQRVTNTPQITQQRNVVHEGDHFNDSKSENEEGLGDGSSDSDYYDPTMEHQDSMDSMDSEDAILSDTEISMNSSNENIGTSRNLSRSSGYAVDRSNKRKLSNRDGNSNKNSSSYAQSNYSPTSSHQRSSSRNRQTYSNKSSSHINNSVSNHQSSSSNNTTTGMYRVVGVGPVEVGAHLRLLGESLAIIGERLKEHEGQIAVSGSVSVLLDTLLCSLAPLICLTAHVPSIAPPLTLLQDTLDNIAYIMPGL